MVLTKNRQHRWHESALPTSSSLSFLGAWRKKNNLFRSFRFCQCSFTASCSWWLMHLALVNEEAATGILHYLESYYTHTYFGEAFNAYRWYVFTFCVRRKLLLQQTLEVYSEQWLNEFGCHIDGMHILFVKQITPRCLVFGLFLRHQHLTVKQQPLFFLPPLQNTLQEVFKGKKVYEGCIK